MRRERAQVVRAFPGGIFDTKHLARSLPRVFEGGTSLGEVYNRMHGRGEDDSKGVLLNLSQGMRGGEGTERCFWCGVLSMMVAMRMADGEPTRVALPVLHHAEGFTRYQHPEAADSMAHEAG